MAWPVLTLDFETYYDQDYTLKKLTTLEYVRDPRFEVYGASIKLNDGPPRWYRAAQFREVARTIPWHQVAVLAHHSQFEGLILHDHYGINRVGFWFDTLAMGRALYSGEIGAGLEELAPFLGIGDKGVMPDIKGKRPAQLTEQEWRDLQVYCDTDVEREWAAFRIMAPRFSQTELRLMDITTRMYSEPVFVIDEPLLREYAEYEERRRAELLTKVGGDKKVFTSNDKFAALLRAHGVEPAMKPSPTAKHPDGTPKQTYAFAKTDVRFQELLEHPDETIRLLCEARVMFKSTIRQSRTQRLLLAGAGGRPVPVYLKYSPTHTGRWGGGDAMNWQNFDKVKWEKVDGQKVMVYGTGMMKRGVLAPPGCLVVAADSSQIEARKTAYLAKQEDLLADFAAGADVYSKFASKIYRRHVDRKANVEDEMPGQVGKVCVLGLGFGMGWHKFAWECVKGPLGGSPIIFGKTELEALDVNVGKFVNNPKNIERVREIPTRLNFEDMLLHCCVASEVVDRYRAETPEITKYREYLDSVIPLITLDTDTVFGYNSEFIAGKGRVVLPSGREIRFPKLARRQTGPKKWEWTYFEDHEWKRLYGGKLLENLVQATSRDIIGDQIVTLSFEYKIATMTHDEIVSVVRENRAQECLGRMLAVMKVPSSWAPGLPLAAEGGFHRSYGGVK